MACNPPQTPRDVHKLKRNQIVGWLHHFGTPLPENTKTARRAELTNKLICAIQNEGKIEYQTACKPRKKISRREELEQKCKKYSQSAIKYDNEKKTMNERMNECKETEFSDFDNILSNLYQTIEKGISARYNMVNICNAIENTSFCESDSIKEIKSKLSKNENNQFNGWFDATIIDIIDINDGNNDNEMEFEIDTDLIQIEKNIEMWCIKNGQYGKNGQCDNDKLFECKKNGLFVTCNVKKFTILARLVGDEMLESEFYKIYELTFDQYKRQLHSWTVDISYKNENDNQINETLLIDCLGKEYKPNAKVPILLNIAHSIQNDQQNVMFVVATINQWPGIFVVTKRDISTNEQLVGYFGDEYNHLEKQANLQQQLVKSYIESIENAANKLA